MASQLISGDLISDRYASALYELALENKAVDLVFKDLSLIKEILNNNKDMQLVVKSPLISSNDKLEIILKLISSQKINNLSSTFLKVISKNKRFINIDASKSINSIHKKIIKHIISFTWKKLLVLIMSSTQFLVNY